MHTQPLKAQQGAATIIMSVLVGFSITAMGLALMFNVQNAQDKQVTAQAQVSAQNLAWAGSEAFRQLLVSMPIGLVNVLPLNEPMTPIDSTNVQKPAGSADLQGRLTPTVINRAAVAASGGLPARTEVTVNLAAVNPMAGVGTTLQMVYGIFTGAGSGLPSLDPITFYHDAGLQGTVNFKNVAAGQETLSVKGSVTLTSQVTGLNAVHATGDVTINNSNVVLKEVTANGTVNVSGDGKVLDKLVGLAGVNITQGFVGSVFSNGNINYRTGAPPLGGSNIVSAVAARGSVSINNQNNLVFNDIGSVTTTALSGCGFGVCFKRTEAGGALTAYPPTLDSAYSKTSLTCSPPPAFPAPPSLQPASEAVAPSFAGCATAVANTKFRTGTPSLKLIMQLPPLEMTPLKIDVWEQQAVANYYIRVSGLRTLVTVKNVKRAAVSPSPAVALNGEYELVRSGSLGYLCPLDALGAQVPGCTVAAAPKNVFCTDNCWTVQAGGSTAGAAPNTFVLVGKVAPGVIFFDGNLSLKFNPISSAAFLAAGFIKTEGNTGKSLALNFAGPAGGTAAGTTLPGVCSNLASTSLNLTPSNFCLADGSFDSTAANKLGNVALMAGGYRRSVTTTTAVYKAGDKASETTVANLQADGRTSYVITKVTPNSSAGTTVTEVITQQPYAGGDIQLAADNVVFGSLLAGNMLKTEGTTTVYGYVVSSALARTPSATGGSVLNDGGLGLTQNLLSAATNIDHSIQPQYYDGKTVPGTASGTPPASTGNDVRVLRSRYL
ncbi:MAG TPA: hypothetical protein PK129_00560 [Cellvibrionaceae bacterium]|nr:hypothetical protein [Cellvibrionaceae bacterium]